MKNIKIFHTIGFIPSEDKINRNNFLPATLHCLTNIKFLTNFILGFNNTININKLLNSYQNLLQEISRTNQKEISITNFEKILFENDEYINDKEKCNPKFLFDNLITNFHQFYLKQFNNTTIFDNISVVFQTTLSCPQCQKQTEEIKKEEKYLVYDIRKEYKDEDDDKYNNIYDCLKNYLNNEKEIINKKCTNCKKETLQKAKKIYKTLPEVLIIHVDYGNDKTYILDREIEFNEKLDFSTINNIDIEETYRNKKYYLSSLICVREIMGIKREYFYTFCRESEESKYFCFNEEKVHEVKDIDKKLKKSEINLNNKKERFPYILIYSSFSQ